MATKLDTSNTLVGLDALMAGQPPAATPQGGIEFGFRGENQDGGQSAQSASEPTQDFTGMGPLLEEEDGLVFKTTHNLVLRQRLIYQNHLAQDIHWTYVKLGYPFSTLEKLQDQDIYKQSLPQGVSSVSVQAVPNEAWNLVNKTTEALTVDLGKPDPTPLNDSEVAERASEMCEQFLTQTGGPAGMNEANVVRIALERSLVTASAYVHYWTDPTGGGYVPLQIQAHPQAVDANNPLIGPDGQPTTDPVLRYVTPNGQFTDDPSQAGQQWMPRIVAEHWNREHIRVFPETADVQHAEKIIGIYYTTVGMAKKRWPTVRNMDDDAIATLCDWTPPTYLPLLPPFLRSRWKINTGSPVEKSGSSDERVLFYYVIMARPRPNEHPYGAEVYVSGAFGGLVLNKDTLAMQVKVPSLDGQGDQMETRCMDLPVNQMRPRPDPDDRDPSGRGYLEMFGGATEFDATLAMGYLMAIDQILHVEKYANSTSPVQGYQIAEARATGDAIPVLNLATDLPKYADPHPLPSDFLGTIEWSQSRIENLASQPKPLQGSDNQQEVSGKSRQIAVQQGQVGLSSMNANVAGFQERHWRLVLQQAQKNIKAPLLIRFTGDDGAYKVEWFNAQDFALVGNVGLKDGTGTLMTPGDKVNYANSLLQAQVIGKDEASAIMRPAFQTQLGGGVNPHEQRLERCVSLWLQGMPKTWPQEAQAFQQSQQAQQAYQQQVAPLQQQGLPVPPPPPQAPAPFNPFAPRPNDSEPEIAELWVRRLSRLMSTVRYSQQPPEWRQLVDQAYTTARNTLAQAMKPQQPDPIDQKALALVQSFVAQLAAKATEQQMFPQMPPAQAPPAGGPINVPAQP